MCACSDWPPFDIGWSHRLVSLSPQRQQSRSPSQVSWRGQNSTPCMESNARARLHGRRMLKNAAHCAEDHLRSKARCRPFVETAAAETTHSDRKRTYLWRCSRLARLPIGFRPIPAESVAVRLHNTCAKALQREPKIVDLGLENPRG